MMKLIASAKKTLFVQLQYIEASAATGDAGVIIESAPIAQYFENVFLADWNNKAKPFVAKGAAAAPKPAKKRA